MNITDLKKGQSAIIKQVNGETSLRQHFLDMGIITGTPITLIKYAPLNDPIEIRIHNYELTLRLEEAQQIEVELMDQQQPINHKERLQDIPHPGLGEYGRYHDKKSEHPLKEKTVLRFGLVGNQNCGKTTLFNQLTGSNQHVGNFPGVTVDQKSGSIKNHPNTLVTDLPGIYSLSPYSAEEIVSRNYLLQEKPHCIINIIDATNIERNLYLTMQLMELDIPMVLAINMMDELRGNHGAILVNAMEKALGIPIVCISASKNEGIEELIDHAIHVAKYQEKGKRIDFCDQKQHHGALHRGLHGIMHLIEDHCQNAQLPLRFASTKVVENDSLVIQALQLDENEKEMIEHIIIQMEKESGFDRYQMIAEMRFHFINQLVEQTVIKPQESKEHQRSEQIDRILTGKYTAFIAFVGIIFLIFYLTFHVFGAFFQDLLAKSIESFTVVVDSFLTNHNVNPILHSLLIDGVFTGVGSVLSFLPIILILFLFLSLLEDSGYMARIAFVMDRPLRKIGLSGRSIVPLLIGFGCSVPAVMSSRTLPSKRDRQLTIFLIPFMSCSAKLPIYGFLISTFFPQQAGFLMVGLYFLSIVIGLVITIIYKRLFFETEAAPFVMELPNYRFPTWKSTTQLLWEKAKDFLTKAFSIIFIASIVIWFLQNFDLSFQFTAIAEESLLAQIASVIGKVFQPLGFADYRIATALITGFMAKESVVSTLTVLFGSSSAFANLLDFSSAAALLVFCLLYTPCIATIASIQKEVSSKYALYVVISQCIIAYIVAFCVKLVIQLILVL